MDIVKFHSGAFFSPENMIFQRREHRRFYSLFDFWFQSSLPRVSVVFFSRAAEILRFASAAGGPRHERRSREKNARVTSTDMTDTGSRARKTSGMQGRLSKTGQQS